ncbi:hypothetical protein Hypma_003820 [Hypsizygus marmoreus]|uniref:Uncharacterized protein n=1 Tax=Hypsizygus marmoreus TaxID=39966 RepID=A0A369K4K9_HYPMA|nr:hypothetical protein Hypma_003820 [Hypsizygus marmoreus]
MAALNAALTARFISPSLLVTALRHGQLHLKLRVCAFTSLIYGPASSDRRAYHQWPLQGTRMTMDLRQSVVLLPIYSPDGHPERILGGQHFLLYAYDQLPMMLSISSLIHESRPLHSFPDFFSLG